MSKHYGSTAIKYQGDLMIAFATCTCGWRSEDEICDLSEADEDYSLRDYIAIIGALTEISLNIHLKGVECESFDD